MCAAIADRNILFPDLSSTPLYTIIHHKAWWFLIVSI